MDAHSPVGSLRTTVVNCLNDVVFTERASPKGKTTKLNLCDMPQAFQDGFLFRNL
jgi:hypothetical protein